MPSLTDAETAALLEAAREAASQAYCRYSNFHVGAAVRAGGQVFVGCNVENGSYGLTICAERVAIFTAVAAGHRRLEAAAVACVDAASDSDVQRMPCGSCRQVLAEFGDDDLPVLIDGVGAMRLGDLLPQAFRLR